MIKKRQEVSLLFGSAAIVLVLFFELFAGQASASNSATIAEGLVLWKAIVLGVVEGLTEFLPISSTGHLLAAKELMHLDSSEISEQAIDLSLIHISEPTRRS